MEKEARNVPLSVLATEENKNIATEDHPENNS
jgi:hypothetical protein